MAFYSLLNQVIQLLNDAIVITLGKGVDKEKCLTKNIL